MSNFITEETKRHTGSSESTSIEQIRDLKENWEAFSTEYRRNRLPVGPRQDWLDDGSSMIASASTIGMFIRLLNLFPTIFGVPPFDLTVVKRCQC